MELLPHSTLGLHIRNTLQFNQILDFPKSNFSLCIYKVGYFSFTLWPNFLKNKRHKEYVLEPNMLLPSAFI